jgi:hypothetical protein
MKNSHGCFLALWFFAIVQLCPAQNGSPGFWKNSSRTARTIPKFGILQDTRLAYGSPFFRKPLPHTNNFSLPDSVPSKTDTVPSKTDSLPQHTEGVSTKTVKISYRDSTVSNIYGDLLDDDPVANPKYPLWMPIFGVIEGNFITWSIDRGMFNADFSRVGFRSWEENFNDGWEWDSDGFGINHFFHPYGGSMAFNSGRASGYSFFESVPFAFGSSLMWEMMGENTKPSYNDLINTTVNGAFAGEILYRLSSNVLDDRTTGMARFFRELFAAFLDPRRGFNRLIHGRTFHVNSERVYQKEPLNVSFSIGAHNINVGSQLGTGVSNVMLNAQFVYGNPFELRSRKPFDFFKLRFDMNFGEGPRIIDNITGYGLLFGSNHQAGTFKFIAGGFQHFDYWDNYTYQLTAIGLGGGIFSQLPILTSSVIETGLHLAVVPLGAISSPYVAVGDRYYSYGGGMEGKFENIFDLGWGSLTTDYFFYYLQTYVGAAGHNVVSIFKPRLAVHLFGGMSVGFEYLMYQRNGFFNDYPEFYSYHTEQKIYVVLNLENFGIKD